MNKLKELLKQDTELLRKHFILKFYDKIEIVEDLSIPTASISVVIPEKNPTRYKLRIRYNPEILDKISYRFIISHEMLHFVFSHFNRRPHDVDVHTWNCAGDLAINSLLNNPFFLKGSDNEFLKRLLFPSHFALPDNKSTEFYYEKIKEKKIDILPFEENQESKEGQEQSKEESKEEQQPQEQPQKEQKNQEEEEYHPDEVPEQYRETIENDFLRRAGDIIKEILPQPKAKNWKNILYEALNSIFYSSPDNLRKSKKYYTSKFFVPKRKREKMLDKVSIYVDVSGSISDELCGHFVGYLLNILQDTPIQEVFIYQFSDEAVLDFKGEVQALTDYKFKRRLSGGTSFFFLEEETNPIVIVLTDGIGEYPKRPSEYIEYLFFVTTRGKPPFEAIVVSIDELSEMEI